jgi:Uma2 family endonuclease
MSEAATAEELHFEPDPERLSGRPMSIEAWEAMDEDAPGELVDGILEEEEVPDNPHEIVVNALIFLLGLWSRPRGGGVLGSEAKFVVGRRRGRKPDVSVFFSRDRKLVRRGANRRPPDIMIEVVSRRPRDRRRDQVEKLNEYAAFGVPWYWIVDPEARTLTILRLRDDGHYAHALDADEGVFDVPGCEGLRLDVSALWREIDDWIQPEEGSEEG